MVVKLTYEAAQLTRSLKILVCTYTDNFFKSFANLQDTQRLFVICRLSVANSMESFLQDNTWIIRLDLSLVQTSNLLNRDLLSNCELLKTTLFYLQSYNSAVKWKDNHFYSEIII